jgi:hypothetical protein
MIVRDIHSTHLTKATTLSGFAMPDAIRPLEVITVLNKAGVRFTLAGAYGIGGWIKKTRATEDVDVIVAARDHKKAIAALLAAFPHLQADDHEVVTRLRDAETQQVAIDLMKPNDALFREALKNTRWVENGGQRYQIPSLEMSLAMKFASMISLNRGFGDRHIDAHDFIYMVQGNAEIDLTQLAKLGELVYPGGGEELLQHVQDVRAGKNLRI